MKVLSKFLLVFILTCSGLVHSKDSEIRIELVNGDVINLDDHKDKTILITNIATRCGYTSQLDGLEKLHNKYKNKKFLLIAVPSNDFGGQTPENNENVVKFCKLNYGVTFPIAKKSVVTGKKKSELFKYLLSKTNKEEISWNFEKFVISPNAKSIKRFKSYVSPLSQNITSLISSGS